MEEGRGMNTKWTGTRETWMSQHSWTPVASQMWESKNKVVPGTCMTVDGGEEVSAFMKIVHSPRVDEESCKCRETDRRKHVEIRCEVNALLHLEGTVGTPRLLAWSNQVPTTDSQGERFIVTERVGRTCLRTLVNRLVMRKKPSIQQKDRVDQNESIFFEVCGRIIENHKRGVVHLDVDPANIILAGIEPDNLLKTYGKGQVSLVDYSASRTMAGTWKENVFNVEPGGHHVDTPTQVRDGTQDQLQLTVEHLFGIYGEEKIDGIQYDRYQLGILAMDLFDGRSDLARKPESMPIDLFEMVSLVISEDPWERLASSAQLETMPWMQRQLARVKGEQWASRRMTAEEEESLPRVCGPADNLRRAWKTLGAACPLDLLGRLIARGSGARAVTGGVGVETPAEGGAAAAAGVAAARAVIADKGDGDGNDRAGAEFVTKNGKGSMRRLQQEHSSSGGGGSGGSGGDDDDGEGGGSNDDGGGRNGSGSGGSNGDGSGGGGGVSSNVHREIIISSNDSSDGSDRRTISDGGGGDGGSSGGENSDHGGSGIKKTGDDVSDISEDTFTSDGSNGDGWGDGGRGGLGGCSEGGNGDDGGVGGGEGGGGVSGGSGSSDDRDGGGGGVGGGNGGGNDGGGGNGGGGRGEVGQGGGSDNEVDGDSGGGDGDGGWSDGGGGEVGGGSGGGNDGDGDGEEGGGDGDGDSDDDGDGGSGTSNKSHGIVNTSSSGAELEDSKLATRVTENVRREGQNEAQTASGRANGAGERRRHQEGQRGAGGRAGAPSASTADKGNSTPVGSIAAGVRKRRRSEKPVDQTGAGGSGGTSVPESRRRQVTPEASPRQEEACTRVMRLERRNKAKEQGERVAAARRTASENVGAGRVRKRGRSVDSDGDDSSESGKKSKVGPEEESADSGSASGQDEEREQDHESRGERPRRGGGAGGNGGGDGGSKGSSAAAKHSSSPR